MDVESNNTKNKNYKEARTFLPEILAPGTGLTPLTQKSVLPTNNVVTIQDILDGKKYRIPSGGGDWSSGWGEDVSKSYKEDGDMYKRQVRDNEILAKMMTPNPNKREKWKVKVPGGSKVLMSLDLANEYKRKILEKGIKAVWVSRVAKNSNDEKSRVEIVSDSLSKTFMVESFDIYNNVKEIGSAFCVGYNFFITCAHVIKKYNKNTEKNIKTNDVSGMIKINLIQNGKKYDAELVNFNPIWDIALLKSNISSNFFDFDTQINIGEEILAIGCPHGFENNVTFGSVGSLDRVIYSYKEAPKYMFVDLSAFPGNSGGPIIKTTNGKIVGMLTAIVSNKGDYGLNAGLPSYYIERFCSMEGIL